LAWRRIVEGIIVEKSWKHLVNAAPVVHMSCILHSVAFLQLIKRTLSEVSNNLDCNKEHCIYPALFARIIKSIKYENIKIKSKYCNGEEMVILTSLDKISLNNS
jgi:hypothetical protein